MFNQFSRLPCRFAPYKSIPAHRITPLIFQRAPCSGTSSYCQHISCIVRQHLLRSITALCNPQHRANARDVSAAVGPVVRFPVCLPLVYCARRVIADTTPQHQPEGKLCSGQNDEAKCTWDVMGQGRAEQSGGNQAGCAGWKGCNAAGFGAVWKTCPTHVSQGATSCWLQHVWGLGGSHVPSSRVLLGGCSTIVVLQASWLFFLFIRSV